MATFSDRLAILITAEGKGAVREFQSVGGSAERELGKASTAADRFTGLIARTVPGLSGIETQGLKTGTVLKGAVAGGAIAAGVALASFAVQGVSSFEEATGEVRQLQRTMGGTAEDASRLRFVAKALGVDLTAVARGSGLLAKSIGNGTSKLAEYGVEVARDSKGNVDMAGTIANVAQAFQATDDPAKRAAIGAAAFGRGWQELTPILGKSRAELKALYDEAGQSHQIFSDADTEAGRRLSVATRELSLEMQGLQLELARGLVPALADATHGLTEGLQGLDDATSSVGGLDTAFGYLVDNVTGPVVHGVGTFGELFQGHFVNALKEGVHAIPGVGSAIGSLTNWLDTGSDSSDKAAKAAQRHAKAEAERNTEFDLATQKIRENTAALTAQTNATVSSWSSDLGAAQAKVSLNQAVSDGTVSLDDQGVALSYVNALVQQQGDHYTQLTGKTADTATQQGFLKNALQTVGAQFPTLLPLVQQYLVSLIGIPPTVNTHVNLDITSAEYKLGILQHKFDSLQNAMGLIGPSRT